MKKILLIIAMLLPVAVFAQEETVSSKQTTFEKFTSPIGKIVKFKDYELPTLESKFGSGFLSTTYSVQVGIREVIVDNDKSLFLHLTYQAYEKPERNAFIAFNDVIEIDKALDELIKQKVSDTTGEASYLENKFKTIDDFMIGYYISKNVSKKGEVTYDNRWYIDLDNRYNYSTAFFNAPDELSKMFKSAIARMNELK